MIYLDFIFKHTFLHFFDLLVHISIQKLYNIKHLINKSFKNNLFFK